MPPHLPQCYRSPNHIRASGDTSVIHGYLIHSPRFQMSKTTTTFWQIQATIISQLRLIQLLSIIIAMIHPDHDGRSVKTFSANLKSNGWVLSSTDVFYPNLGDTIAGSCCLIIAIHSSCTSTVNPLLLKRPPLVPTHPIGEFIWEPFNRPEHAISLAHNDADFDKQDTQLKVSTIKSMPNNDRGIIIKYSIHRPDSDNTVLVGLEVISVDGLCPAFNACPNLNISKPILDSSLIMRVTHTSKPFHPTNLFTASTSSTSSLTDSFNHHTNFASTPLCLLAHPSGYSSKSTHIWCTLEIDANSELFLPNQFAAPAATIQAFVNGAIRIWLPSRDQWIKAYSNDKEMSTICDLITNPFKINNTTLNTVNYNYRVALCQSLIVIEDDMLIFRGPVRGGSSYTRLQLVPAN
jgi:hypothetical protein